MRGMKDKPQVFAIHAWRSTTIYAVEEEGITLRLPGRTTDNLEFP